MGQPTQTGIHARRRRKQRQRSARREEGAVMLVVLLILMVGTASAAVSVNATQAELRSVGRARLAQQARYASEAAMMSTISYIDLLFKSGDWQDMWDEWSGEPEPPVMDEYGDAPIDPVQRHNASRISMASQSITQQANEFSPLGNAQPGGAGGPALPDLVGSLGPRNAYVVPTGDADGGFVVDLTDCFRAPSTLVAGESSASVQFYCVLTARSRLSLPSQFTRPWQMPSGRTFDQAPFEARHESRAIIITPPVLVPL